MTLNFFNQSKPYKAKPFNADDRQRAVNVVREFLSNQEYIPAEVAKAMLILVPELRDRQADGE